VVYLIAGGLYFLAALLGFCISKYAILNTVGLQRWTKEVPSRSKQRI